MANRWIVYDSALEHQGMNFRLFPKTSGVYQILNTVNQKRYIGYATNLRGRCKCHRVELRHKSHKNSHLQNTWNLYGERCFEFSIIQFCEIEKLRYWEDYWCKVTGVHNREYGYNIQPTDPEGDYRCSEETKKKIGDANRGREFPQRRKPKKEPKKRVGKRGADNHMFGKKMSEDCKKKMIETKKKNADILFESTGYRVSESARQNMIKALNNRYLNTPKKQKRENTIKPNGKTVINIITGNLYKSCAEIAKLLGINYLTLNRMLRGVYTNNTDYRYIDSNNKPIQVRTVRPKKIVKDAQKIRASENMKFQWQEGKRNNNHLFGSILTEESKKKRRETFKRMRYKELYREQKGKRVIDVNGKIYNSLSDVSDITGIPKYELSRKLLGKRKNNTIYKYI